MLFSEHVYKYTSGLIIYYRFTHHRRKKKYGIWKTLVSFDPIPQQEHQQQKTDSIKKRKKSLLI